MTLLAACGSPEAVPAARPVPPARPPAAVEAAPTVRLPDDVRPLRYALSLDVDPRAARYAGTASVTAELTKARDVIWIHGRELRVASSVVTPDGAAPVAARWTDETPDGVAALRLDRPVGPGRVTIHIVFDAPFGTQLKGLFGVSAGGSRYAFTQLEPTWARDMFPCFDEPTWKTPFDVALIVPTGDAAIANTRATKAEPVSEGKQKVTFATTEPLPTYLVAIATGPLDVVAGPDVPPNVHRKFPLPLRGVAARGKGPGLAYALERTGPILTTLEDYFGIAYPYDKLDILAVPDMGGAMENAGAVTFRDWLLLVDPKTAPIEQERAFASVMAHELAHQWFGNLVTMPWWDDIWLNEAFATWMAARTVATWRPADEADIGLLARVHGAMGADSLVSARQIRQPVASRDDISNAFDSITYSKGGGVLAMFERWLGPEVFQRGIRDYLGAHRHGSATSDDLLVALSKTSGRDVATPFRTFLEKPGVPLVEATLVCEKEKAPALKLRQSRDLPLGSAGDRDKTWQIPVCARYAAEKGWGVGGEVRESCTLLTEKEGTLPLAGECPSWVLPNADAAGYYRWALREADMKRLLDRGLARLSIRERMSVAHALGAAFSRGTLAGDAVLAALAPLARDEHPQVATAPMDMLESAADWLAGTPSEAKVLAYARRLYERRARELGWEAKKGANEPPARAILRQRVLAFMALTARDEAVRKEAARRGRAYVGFGTDGKIHPEAVDANLAGTALAVALQEEGAKLFDALAERLATENDPAMRGRILGAIGRVDDPVLAARARELAFDTTIRVVEAADTLLPQMQRPATREAAWAWMKEHLDALAKRLPPRRAGGLPWAGTSFCDEAHAAELEALFTPRIGKLDGGPRNLSGSLEAIRLCAARRDKQLASVKTFFERP